MANTRNQEIDRTLKEHEQSLFHLESVAEKNSNDLATLKTQMGEILKNLQLLNNGREGMNAGNRYSEEREEGEG